jgi:hypothetical protein
MADPVLIIRKLINPSMDSLKDFIKSQGMTLMPEKRIVNTKLTFILNDQMSHFVAKDERGSFLEFLFKNAMDKNGKDLGKVSDFFSRISNTLEQSAINLYEFKTFLRLVAGKDNSKERIREYLHLRSVLLKLKDEEGLPQVGTSLVFLRYYEINLFLDLFGIQRKFLEDFLEKEGLDFDSESISLDLLIFMSLKLTSTDSRLSISPELTERTKRVLRKNKLRRVLLKVKFVSALLVTLRKHSDGKKIQQFTDTLEQMRRMLKDSSMEAAAQAAADFQSSFFSLHSEANLSRLESVATAFRASWRPRLSPSTTTSPAQFFRRKMARAASST